MFDFGFTELMLIAVVALIVVGPERLPKVARTAGHLLGRLQRYVSDVKSDISREMQLEDLKKLQQQVEQQARDLESSVRSQMHDVESDLGKTARQVSRDLSLDTDKSALETPRPQSSSPESAPPVSEAHRVQVDPSVGASAGGAAETGQDAGDNAASGSTEGAQPASTPQLELELDRASAAAPRADKP